MTKPLLYIWLGAFFVLVLMAVAQDFRHRQGDQSAAVDALTDGPHIGQTAPDFAAPALDGHIVHRADLRGKTVLAFFCGCDRCHAAATKIGQLQRQGKLPNFVSIVALEPGDAKTFIHQTGIRGLVLTNPDDTISDSYASSFCPRLWIIDPAGKIAYRSDIALEGPDLDTTLQTIGATSR